MKKLLAAFLVLIILASMLAACQKDPVVSTGGNGGEGGDDDFVIQSQTSDTTDTGMGTTNNQANSDAFTPVNLTIYVMADVNLRTEPSTKSDSTKDSIARKGDALTATAKNDDWYQINHSSKTLYVLADYVTSNQADTVFTALDTPLNLTLKPSGDSEHPTQVNLRDVPVVYDTNTFSTVGKTVYEEAATGTENIVNETTKTLVATKKNGSGNWYEVTYGGNTYYLKITTSTKNIIIGLPTSGGPVVGG